MQQMFYLGIEFGNIWDPSVLRDPIGSTGHGVTLKGAGAPLFKTNLNSATSSTDSVTKQYHL